MATVPLPSHSFRLEHAEFKQHFGHLDAMIGALATVSPHEQPAHMEEEEGVLLPVLDRTMTAEEFQREVIDDPRELPPPGPATAEPGRIP